MDILLYQYPRNLLFHQSILIGSKRVHQMKYCTATDECVYEFQARSMRHPADPQYSSGSKIVVYSRVLSVIM